MCHVTIHKTAISREPWKIESCSWSQIVGLISLSRSISCLLPGQRISGLRPSTRWPGNNYTYNQQEPLNMNPLNQSKLPKPKKTEKNRKKPKKTSPKFEICGSVRFFSVFFGFFRYFSVFFGFFRYFSVFFGFLWYFFGFFRSELRQEIPAIQKSCQQCGLGRPRIA